jgi:predicted outer membrane repeat protein
MENAYSVGGAIYVNSQKSNTFNLEILDTAFIQNTARASGGAIYMEFSRILTVITFTNC